MPEVDGKKFPYTKKGMRAAKEEAKQSGKKMETKKYFAGGMPATAPAPDKKGGNSFMSVSEEERKKKKKKILSKTMTKMMKRE